MNKHKYKYSKYIDKLDTYLVKDLKSNLIESWEKNLQKKEKLIKGSFQSVTLKHDRLRDRNVKVISNTSLTHEKQL